MSVHDLFGQTVQIAKPSRQDINHRGKDSLDQYFTPEWAERLVENLFPDLTPADFVIEPSCGKGAFLKVIPTEVPALGIEMIPCLPQKRAESSGRQVLCGDFRTIDLPANPTVIVGNPFRRQSHRPVHRASQGHLPDNGRCGLILPAYVLQYPTRIVRWNQDWTLQQWMIPRELFVDLIKPLVFCMLRKEKVKILHGFLLQEEALDFRRYDAKAKLLLVKGKKRQSSGQPSWPKPSKPTAPKPNSKRCTAASRPKARARTIS